jgi:hypothetical protein
LGVRECLPEKVIEKRDGDKHGDKPVYKLGTNINKSFRIIIYIRQYAFV